MKAVKSITGYNDYLYEHMQQSFKRAKKVDIMEVLFGLAHKMGYTEEKLINKRQEKKSARGGFEKNIVLKSTK